MSDIVLCLFIFVYIMLVVCLFKGVVRFMKKQTKGMFTYEQFQSLRSVKHDQKEYGRRYRRYRALNKSARYGRVLGLDGSVICKGFRYKKDK